MQDCKKDIVVYPVEANNIYDSVRTINKISSNIPVNFNIVSGCYLPKNSKIEILETRFKYNLCNINRNVLINGHNVKCDSNSLEDIICIKENYINLVDDNCSVIMLNVTEGICFEFNVTIEIKGKAYVSGCDPICFEAVGEGKDNIKTILISSICIPNLGTCIERVRLKLKNDIIGLANPEYLFLSPIYDCDMTIGCLLGNVFLNYIVSLDILSLIPMQLNVLGYKENTLQN